MAICESNRKQEEISLEERASVIMNQNSTLDEIKACIKELSKPPYSQSDLDKVFANLVALEIDSYSFTYGANLLARNITKDDAVALNDYLEAYERHDSKCNDSYAFVSYYLLAYYYREYEEMAKLKKLIPRYDDLFPQYALAHQIRGRMLRRQKGQGRKALDCDLQAMRILEEKHIENIGVSVTYASTVSLALENSETFINDTDVKKSIDSVRQAININPLYGKYDYLLAKLLMFDLLRHEDDFTYDECIDIIMEAKELLRKAIELEDSQTVAYASQVIEFKSYMRQADWILSEIRMLKGAKKQASDAEKVVQERISETKERVDELLKTTKAEIAEKFETNQKKVNDQFNANQEKVTEQLNQMQNKYMEILALFVSVVSVVMVFIDMLSNKFSSVQLIIALVAMNTCVIAVYAVFLILLKKVEKKYIITLFISLLILIAMFILVA